MNKRFASWAVLALAVVLALPATVYPILLMKIMCYALFASAFNLLLGFTGLLSFGHAAFFGASAYLAGHAMKVWGWPPEAGLLLGSCVGTALGGVVGALAIRRQGIYFAMVTLALAQLVYFVCVQAPLTGGEDGLQEVPRGRLLGVVDLTYDVNLYYLVAFVFCSAMLLIHRIVNSPFGEIVRAIRDNEQRAQSLGYDVGRFKLIVFMLSAGLAGTAGALKVLVFQFATLSDVHWHASGEVVLMTLLGGMGTLSGPTIGAAFVVLLQNGLADTAGSLVTVVMGCAFMACVLAFRQGIWGALEPLATRVGMRLGMTRPEKE